MNERTWCVYVHVNKVNGKRYVGITSKSKPEHRWNGGRGYKENPYFYSAIVKYGWDMFDHIILYSNLSEDEAKQMERKLIAEWHTQDRTVGYNLTSGGDGTPDYHPSEETRAKLSNAKKRENLSAETLRRRSEGLSGRKFTDEHKRKIGDANSKPIEMLSIDDELLASFDSAREAEIKTHINHSHISQCCHGSRISTGGYKWRFAQSL